MAQALSNLITAPRQQPAAAQANIWLPAIALGVAMAIPTLIFFGLTVINRNNVYMQAASVFVFVIPIIMIGAQARFDPIRLRNGLFLLFLLTGPIWISIFSHLPSYSFINLGTAVSRTVGLTMYLLTMIVLSCHPQCMEILKRSFVVLAMIILTLIVLGSVLLPDWHYRRFTPADIHPNWWGELSVALAFTASFIDKRWRRYSVWFVALGMTILVQNRSAIGHVLLVMAFSTLAHEGFRRLLIIALVGLFGAVPIVLLLDMFFFNGSLFAPLIDWVVDRVLLLNDPVRGASSGFTGRDVGWLFALGVVSENPWTGMGFSRANAMLHDDVDAQIHNGHLMLVADLGIIGYSVMAIVMLGAIFRILRQGDFIVFGYAAGFMFFNMMFIPRSINLSVLPMLFWMMVILAWLPRGSAADDAPVRRRTTLGLPRSTRSDDPPSEEPPKRKLGARWASGGGRATAH